MRRENTDFAATSIISHLSVINSSWLLKMVIYLEKNGQGWSRIDVILFYFWTEQYFSHRRKLLRALIEVGDTLLEPKLRNLPSFTFFFCSLKMFFATALNVYGKILSCASLQTASFRWRKEGSELWERLSTLKKNTSQIFWIPLLEVLETL